MQGRAKRGHVAEFGIGEDRRHRRSRRLAPGGATAGPVATSPETDRRGNARLLPRARRQPFLGQIQRAPRHHARAPVHSAAVTATWQFAILPSAPQYCRATPTECGPCFGKARAVEDQHAAAFGHHRAQPSPDAIRVPRRMRDEMLERLVRDRLGHPRQHRLHRLPLAVAEHALHVRPQRQQLRAMAKAALELLQPSDQSLHARRRSGIDQCAAALPNSSKKYNVLKSDHCAILE